MVENFGQTQGLGCLDKAAGQPSPGGFPVAPFNPFGSTHFNFYLRNAAYRLNLKNISPPDDGRTATGRNAEEPASWEADETARNAHGKGRFFMEALQMQETRGMAELGEKLRMIHDKGGVSLSLITHLTLPTTPYV